MFIKRARDIHLSVAAPKQRRFDQATKHLLQVKLKQRTHLLRVKTEEAGAAKENKKIFPRREKYNIFFLRGSSLKLFRERPAPVLALQCLSLELGCASPPL